MSENSENQIQWEPQADAAGVISEIFEATLKRMPSGKKMCRQFLSKTGTRLLDWVDHMALPRSFQLGEEKTKDRLEAAGFELTGIRKKYYACEKGMFPRIYPTTGEWRMAIKVDDVTEYLSAHDLEADAVFGRPFAAFRRAKISNSKRGEFWIVERHGSQGWEILTEAEDATEIVNQQQMFRLRKRHFETSAEGFEHTKRLIQNAIAAIGVDRACDVFFAEERRYWQSRNRAARVQKSRQDEFGLGWGNHDHHTYRSSRDCFKDLIDCFEMLGFKCRERFYAGQQAGWGAQVLEQKTCGIVIFADVDLSAEEIQVDFSHDGLAARDTLGTVGLWCGLHGESMLQAGMHHLECQFDFKAAQEQLAKRKVLCMAPFTNFDYLKQCFTEPEVWTVDQARIKKLLDGNLITKEQADKFTKEGAVGSHLEILERNDGYKGFNQTGVSDIITKTDPRTVATG